MRTSWVMLALIVLGGHSSGCSSAAKAPELTPEAEAAAALESTRSDEVARYYGTVTYRYPDGRRVVSRTLAERVVDGGHGVITERYWRPASAESRKPAVATTARLERKANENEVAVFDWRESPGGAEGSARMRGPEWNWTSWAYRLRFPDGSWVEGDATISANGWRMIRRAFRNAADLRRKRSFVEIEDELTSVPEARFNELREQLESGRWWL